eukprot:365603-Chlamydomonas_euryale.AAC.2
MAEDCKSLDIASRKARQKEQKLSACVCTGEEPLCQLCPPSCEQLDSLDARLGWRGCLSTNCAGSPVSSLTKPGMASALLVSMPSMVPTARVDSSGAANRAPMWLGSSSE